MKIVREIMGTKIEIELTDEEIGMASLESIRNDVRTNLNGLLESDRIPQDEIDKAVIALADEFREGDSVLDSEWSRLQETADELNKRYGYRMYEVNVTRTIVYKKSLMVRASNAIRAEELANNWLDEVGYDVDEFDDHEIDDDDVGEAIRDERYDTYNADIDEEED